MSSEPLNIVILGASFAGLSVAHHFLDDTLHRLSTTPAAPPYRLVLISPSTHIYWNIGAPRALVAPGLIKEEDSFVAIEPGFKRHKKADFTFIQGHATGLDTIARTVTIESIGAKAQKRASQLMGKRGSTQPQTPTTPASANGSIGVLKQSIPYHALVLATGTSAHSDLLGLHGPHTSTIAALHSFHARVPNASSIVVCGGGPSGVETAGQLATFLNHTSTLSSMLPSKQQKNLRAKLPSKGTKQIILIASTPRLLPALPTREGLKAEKQLHGLGVRVITNTRVESASRSPGTDRWTLKLDNNTTLLCDLYVPATGVSPNTGYVPKKLLDTNGYVQTNPQTLRVDAAGERVYAIGDCASYSSNYVLDVYPAVAPLMINMYHDLLAHELHLASPYGGNDEEIEALKADDALFSKREAVDSVLCPITRRGGVGVLMGIALPSKMVWLMKGRDYRVSKGRRVVVDGNNPYAVRNALK